MCRSVRAIGDRNPGNYSKRNQYYIEEGSESEDSDFFNMYVDGVDDKPYVVKVFVDKNVPIIFEVDTGSKISAINDQFYYEHFSSLELLPCNLKLKSYTGGTIRPLGFILVSAYYCESGTGERRAAHSLPLYVIPGGGPPLLGRAWLRCLQLKNINIKLHHIGQYRPDDTECLVKKLEGEFSDVFASGLGTCIKKFTLKLTDSEPIFHKARILPLALRKPVETELDRLVNEGTLVRVEHSEYGTPIVPVIKKCGGIRICGDYKVTINSKLKREPYPLPRIEELYAALCGSQVFSKIDLAHAYEQVILTESSRPYTTISTHVGTFEYIRTPYGLNCIPEKFQKLMEEVVKGIPMTVVYLDDICVGGNSINNNFDNLREVFKRLQKVGLRIKLEKCDFFKFKVCYLGHIIDQRGLHPDKKKVSAILDAPSPNDVHQLKAFLGLINYYGKFVPHMSTLLYPLYDLLKSKTPWNWSAACEQAFCNVKTILSSDKFLAHYDPTLPLVLSVDSSAYGIGGILAHRYPDGSEKPVCCVSRTLNDAEKSYSQLDKEALAIFFGVVRNHQYLFGRKFIIRTDHKPLSYIFGDKVGIPQTAASRLQRYAARLAAYDFTVEWVSSARNAPADCLSRLPLPRDMGNRQEPVSYLMFLENEFPVNYKDIAEATRVDPILRAIAKYILSGWPENTDVQQEKAYFNRKNNLFIENGCIVYNYRIVVPPKYRDYILRELHEGHLGMIKMKNIARNYVYWPGLDSDIEEISRSCTACRQQRDAPPHAPLTPWEFPSRPWQRLHADFGEYASKHYLILVDAHSKWIEVFLMRSTAARYVITKFRELFARFGLPSQVVTDNGPPFSSHELKQYFNNNGIIHSLTSPYRPQGNGAAENSVKTVKNCIKKAHYEGKDIEQALCKMLFNYRNCEQATTGVAPAVALLGRKLRGRLDALRFRTEEIVRAKQLGQIERAGGRERQVSSGDTVYVRDYSNRNDKWVEGQVSERVGPHSYCVKLPNSTVKRHMDQMLIAKTNKDKKKYSLSCTSSGNDDIQCNTSDCAIERSVATQDTGPSQCQSNSDEKLSPSGEVSEEDFQPASSSPVPKHTINLRAGPRRNRPNYADSQRTVSKK